MQTWIVGSGLTSRDLVSGLILGTVCTAFTYMLWTEGVGFIPVQHVPILGYLEPLAAPPYAFVLVGEVPTFWTIAGGLLIVPREDSWP
ncbi:MAG TPA: DMT family transporter [Thermoleophilia bacterium]|nr:DMT family transporter [Thermoleophilia bacterium]